MKRYDQTFPLETNRTKEEVIHILEARGGKIMADGNIMINHNPPWYRVFAGRGIVTMNFSEKEKGPGVVMQCILSPSLADTRTIAMFLLWNIPLWAALLYFFPWSVVLLVVFLIEWLMMAFIAIPVLLLTVLLVSVYILSISQTWPALFLLLLLGAFLFYL